MEKTIKIMLEYGTNPIWIVEEDDCEAAEIPEEGLSNKRLVDLNYDIQRRYDSLFINNEHEFSYIGFKTAGEAHAFADELREFATLVKECLGDKYDIEDLLDYDLFDHPELYPEG